MRSIVDSKMRKNKSFLEMKLIPGAEILRLPVTTVDENLFQGYQCTPSPVIEERRILAPNQNVLTLGVMGVREGILFQKLDPKPDLERALF